MKKINLCGEWTLPLHDETDVSYPGNVLGCVHTGHLQRERLFVKE